tara:strand:+ start:726 stop:1244 length:519 start_codon:yes stop_codon:yes gene_type:complete
MARRISKKKARKTGRGATFLPEFPDVVRAIAMQGVTDDELAFSFGLNPAIIKGWRKMYGDFDKAIEEGRTIADLQVIEALHKKAIGHSYETDVVIKHGTEYSIETLEKHDPPETNAIKYWLSNRDPERWNRAAAHIQLTGKKGEPPVGVKDETKVELISSILSLIQPKPDGA